MIARASLEEQLQYVYGLERFGIKLGLDVMQRLVSLLGNPHRQWPSVHITGTNGKGSTARFMAECLAMHGLKIGLYTSPHLVRFNERVTINGVEISDERISELVVSIRSRAEAAGLELTFFEFTTALAFLYFAQEHVDLAVVEVGMGGEFDATNVITPLVSVITNIGMDHMPMLGKDRHEIARTKAGIVKPGVALLTGEYDASVQNIFVDACEQHSSPLYRVRDLVRITSLSATLNGQSFVVQGAWAGTYTMRLLGRHQLDNAATALAALALLQERGVKISARAVHAGIGATTWPGRLEVLARQPLILIDGAHNNDGVRALATFLKETVLPRPEVLLLAMKREKNLSDMVTAIAPRFAHVIVTEGSFEPVPAEELARSLASHGSVEAIKDVAQATKAARHRLSDTGLMLATGSLYMVGGAREVLMQEFAQNPSPA